MKHPWLKKDVNDDKARNVPEVAENLREYMQFGDFQKGIVDLLSTLKARNQDLEEVGELFMKYDTDNNGFLD